MVIAFLSFFPARFGLSGVRCRCLRHQVRFIAMVMRSGVCFRKSSVDMMKVWKKILVLKLMSFLPFLHWTYLDLFWANNLWIHTYKRSLAQCLASTQISLGPWPSRSLWVSIGALGTQETFQTVSVRRCTHHWAAKPKGSWRIAWQWHQACRGLSGRDGRESG